MHYKATAFDNRNGTLRLLQVDIDTFELDANKVRQMAIDALYEQMGLGRHICHLVGFQIWHLGGITWYPITDDPHFYVELNDRERFAR